MEALRRTRTYCYTAESALLGSYNDWGWAMFHLCVYALSPHYYTLHSHTIYGHKLSGLSADTKQGGRLRCW